jgi:shikimate dehydrogenase
VPFKFEAARLAQRRSPRAEQAQAANTLGWDDRGQLWGDNTDGIGLVRDLARILVRPEDRLLASQRVLLLGAGGAAAGVLGALIEARAQAVTVWNRNPEKALHLVARHASLARTHGVALEAAATPPLDFDVVINATASSLGGTFLTLPYGLLRPGVLAYDLMYGAAPTPFITQAREAGAQGHDGLGMLVEQAAESYWLWRGVRPNTRPVLAVLQAELCGRDD